MNMCDHSRQNIPDDDHEYDLDTSSENNANFGNNLDLDCLIVHKLNMLIRKLSNSLRRVYG